jgi:arabinofuranan 3-O-arabinosyltransferase
LTAAIWVLAVASLGFRVRRDLTRAGVFDDLLPVWTGVRNFLHHQPVYPLHADLQNYLYPPSSLVLLSPIGFINYGQLKVAFLLLQVVTLFLAAALSLRLVGIRWTPNKLGLVLIGLTIFKPARALFDVENLDSVVVLGEVLALLAMARSRWLLGGILLSLSFSLKPVILPLLLIPILLRKWSSAAAAVALSSVLTVAGVVLTVDGVRFFTSIVPYLGGGQAPLHAWNISLAGAVSLIGLPTVVAAPLRVLTIVAVMALVWRQFQRNDADEPVLIARLSGFVMLGTILAFSYSFQHYLIYLLPFMATFLRPAWGVNRGLALIGVLCIALPDVPAQVVHNATVFWTARLLYTAGCLLLLAAFAGQLIRSPVATSVLSDGRDLHQAGTAGAARTKVPATVER